MHALSPFKNRAAAHRAMALAALHANSSLATRLARYNAHMTKLAPSKPQGVPNEQRPEFLPARRPALC